MASARAWSAWRACRRTRCRSGARPRCGRPSRPGGTPGADRGGAAAAAGDPPSRLEQLRAKYARPGAGTQGGRPGAEDAGKNPGPLHGQFVYRAGRRSRARRVTVKADASEFPGRAPQWNPR